MDTFKEFYLLRIEDESGISGTGVVARGMIFPSGKVVLEWQTFHTSICIYQNINDVESIHSHGGKTKIVYNNPKAVVVTKYKTIPKDKPKKTKK